MRKEIEVKARVSDMGGLVSKLESLDCKLSESVVQDDVVFVKSDDDFLDFKGKVFLRIRKSGGRAIFTVKKPHVNEMDRSEYETEVKDPEQLKGAILLLGYKESVRIVKKRRKAHYKEYEICVDEVEGLGAFVEAEKMTDEEDVLAVQENLFAFLESLGVKRKDRVTQGYDILMHIKLSRS